MSSGSLAKLCGFHLVVIQRVPSFTWANIVAGCFGFVPVFSFGVGSEVKADV
jgi:hypothetical protein